MSDAAFRTVLRGYEPSEVDRHVRALQERTEAVQVSVAERTVELEKARSQHAHAASEAERLRTQLAEIQEVARTAAPPSFADLGERVGQILTLAQEESAQVRAEAQADADRLLQDAKDRSDKAIAQAQAHADEVISRADADVARRLADAQRKSDELLDVADRESAARREEAEAVYERQRAKSAAAAAEFETTLAERRDNAAAEFARALASHDQSLAAAEEKLAAVEREAEARRADSIREADQTLAQARAQAEHVIHDARETAEKVRRESDRELSAASHQREAITAQLSNVRQMLATIGGGAHGVALEAVLGGAGVPDGPDVAQASESGAVADDNAATETASTQSDVAVDRREPEDGESHDVEVLEEEGDTVSR